MRKSLLSIVAGLAIIGTVTAQEDSRVIGTTTKTGANILPAAGDFAIGVDAAPFLGYVGNFFTDANNESPEFVGPDNYFDRTTLFGKYFLTDKSAIRGRVSFDFGTNSTTRTVRDDAAFLADATSELETIDKRTSKNNYLEIGAGYELRRGYGRLQGYYGGEVLVGFGNSSTSYDYGNAITEDNQNPTTYNFGQATGVTSQKNGNLFNFGVGGFVGVEYFVAPKISLGAELGASIISTRTKQGETTTQTWDDVSESVQIETKDLSKNKTSNFEFGTRTNGRLMLSFHF